jgi:hypothetical protein
MVPSRQEIRIRTRRCMVDGMVMSLLRPKTIGGYA